MVPLADSEDRNKMVRDRGMREKQDRHTQTTHTHILLHGLLYAFNLKPLTHINKSNNCF